MAEESFVFELFDKCLGSCFFFNIITPFINIRYMQWLGIITYYWWDSDNSDYECSLALIRSGMICRSLSTRQKPTSCSLMWSMSQCLWFWNASSSGRCVSYHWNASSSGRCVSYRWEWTGNVNSLSVNESSELLRTI